MKEIWESWKGGLLEAALILGAAAGVVSFFEDGRKKLMAAGVGFWWALKMVLSPLIAPFYLMRQTGIDKVERAEFRKMVEDALEDARADRGEIREKVEQVARDFVFNGGSTLRDMMALVESDRQESFWLQRCPAFECLPDGSNVLVSEPYLVLTSVRMEEELEAMDWSQFIFAEDLPVYLAAFRDAAARGAVFRHRSRWTNRLRESRGMWEVLATPIRASGTAIHGHGSILLPHSPEMPRKILRYRGRLRPVDEVALALAEKEGWMWPGV